MDSLKELCEDTLITSLTIENMADLFQLANIYNATKLKAAVIDFAQK